MGALVAAADEPTLPAPVVPPGQKRTQKAIDGGNLAYWPNRADRAEVITAGFIGSKGNEWLTDGGFRRDGHLVLTGNAIGGDFQLSAPVKVLGDDGPPPPPYVPKPSIDGKTKQPRVDQTGQTRYEAVKYTEAGVTGFGILLTPTYDTIAAAFRLGWGSGAITACAVAPDGSVYVAGRAEAGAARLAADSGEVTVRVEKIKGAPCERTFLAKIAPDLSRVLWVRVVVGPAYAPRLTLRADGLVTASLADLRTFDANGKLVNAVAVSGGLGNTTSVSPLNGEVVYGHERSWPTGREPWRCPILNIKEPDGRLRYQLMEWGGPFVGLDSLRLVSDTAVRRVSHDRAGNILAILWSDGGNSVGHCQPTDIRRHIGPGCGLTTAGANATSFAYLMRIEPKNYQGIGWTLWCSRWGRRANGAGISQTGEADDGSTCIGGGSAWGLSQTANRLSTTEPGGMYVAVLTPDLTGVRYSSIVPGAGMAMVGDDTPWGIATGSPGGQGRAVFLCGASKDGENYGLITPTPVVHAMQPKFGGGLLDGWFLVLDLSKPTPPAKIPEISKERMTYARAGRRVDGRAGGDLTVPEGASFVFSPTTPRYATVEAEFRHPDPVTFWPNFFVGRPVSGSIRWSAQGPQGSFVLKCEKPVQSNGEQDRRILGECIRPDAPPALTFTVSSLGPLREETIDRTDSKGNKYSIKVQDCEADAVLELGDRRVSVRPKITFRLNKLAGNKGETLGVSAWLELKGRQLGMKGRAADESFDARIDGVAIKE